jgi:hypothetical protein
MESLKKLLIKKTSTNKVQKNTCLDDKTVFFIFKKIIQEEFGTLGLEKFTPDYFSNQTLFIKSNSSAWSSELLMGKKRIMRKINQEVGSEAVTEIKIK